MSRNTDWDVDYYKTEYESDEHWELRRLFMETHKDNFDEDELVCLAQVFTNVEFMGCKYPDETMRKVALLSKDVAADFRKKRANKLKRTFVGAQDAAGAKVKGRRTVEENNTNNYRKPVQFTPQTSSQNSSTQHQPISIQHNVNTNPNTTQKFNRYDRRPVGNDQSVNKQLASFCNKSLKPNKHRNFILVDMSNDCSKEQNSSTILQSSAAKQKATLNLTYAPIGNETQCTVSLYNVDIAKAISSNKKDARTLANDLALEELQKECYTLKKKPEVKMTRIDTSMGSSNKLSVKTTTGDDQFSNNQLNESNKGFKMMKLLGWSGGALSTGGIEAPIGLAAKQGLKSNSKNTPDGDRYLIVSKKIPIDILATNVLNSGIYAEMYELIDPSGK